ncbi:hypothetical protein DRW07_12380 [Alteromonas sediminis]|uniref:Prepilin-type N-terminal cleavage/methylation domain-containing protein n=1 Tax=Alteromonas sediminis TaxID=2259342 RepID=A0A3N5XZV3_9ALTE|nr:prepilin-type N-terminal cleavage/methylation domain-containing protein [Alteromonas sediminis]RPJ65616.1 hypothetical protein DRW07_12380 [Alteromonas sediminis]
MKKRLGITLIELLLVLALLSLMMLLSGPGLSHLRNVLTHKASANAVEHFLNQARTLSMSNGKPVTVVLEPQTWCLGATVDPSCSCLPPSDCLINNTPYVINKKYDSAITMSSSTLIKGDRILFDSPLGTAYGFNGSFLLTSPVATTRTVISALGRTRTCLVNGNLSGFAQC